MTNRKKLEYSIVGILIVALAAAFLWFLTRPTKALGKQEDKVTWCHTEPNGNQETLELPQQALENAGHVDANGNPLHAGDHAGACVEPSATPSVSPTPTTKPCEWDCDEVTPTATPTPTEEKHEVGEPGKPVIDYQLCTYHECKEMHEPLPGPAGMK